jgi:hypothetical protein
MADKGIHANYVAPIVVGLAVTVGGAALLNYLHRGEKDDPPAPRRELRVRCPDAVTIARGGSELVRIEVDRRGFDGDLSLTASYPSGMFSTKRWLLLRAKALLPATVKRGQSSVLLKVHAGDKPGTYPVTLTAVTRAGAEHSLSGAADVRVVVK